jgi:hypothetical protein
VTYCPYCNKFRVPKRCAEPGCGGYVCGTCDQCNRQERFHGLEVSAPLGGSQRGGSGVTTVGARADSR